MTQEDSLTIRAFLLADIGGAQARFALAPIDETCRMTMNAYPVREYPTLPGALRRFLDDYGASYTVVAAAFAVAGPVLGDTVHLTNSDWICCKKELAALLGTPRIAIMNDFSAVALAIQDLKEADFATLQAGSSCPHYPKIVIGPGAGLGMAALPPLDSGVLRAFPTEAGHIRYASANDREHKIVRLLLRSTSMVTAEHLISGPGLVNLYRANCLLAGKPFKNCKPLTVIDQARAGDALCRQVLDDFAAIFGSVASQVALSWFALGGVYLTGTLLQKMDGDFDVERFLERFNTNPRMSDLLARMPIKRILPDVPTLKGLEAFLRAEKA